MRTSFRLVSHVGKKKMFFLNSLAIDRCRIEGFMICWYSQVQGSSSNHRMGICRHVYVILFYQKRDFFFLSKTHFSYAWCYTILRNHFSITPAFSVRRLETDPNFTHLNPWNPSQLQCLLSSLILHKLL